MDETHVEQTDKDEFARNFAACSWEAMKVFEAADPEGYAKLSALSQELRHSVVNQMLSATDAPDAVAITTFVVEFMTSVLAKIVDIMKAVPEEMAQKAGLHGVSNRVLFDMFAQGFSEMCKQLYDVGEKREAAEEPEEDENNKIVAFVP